MYYTTTISTNDFHTEVPGLWMVETVDSHRSALALSIRWGDRRERRLGEEEAPLHVMLQVNTSREESKCHRHTCILYVSTSVLLFYALCVAVVAARL